MVNVSTAVRETCMAGRRGETFSAVASFGHSGWLTGVGSGKRTTMQSVPNIPSSPLCDNCMIICHLPNGKGVYYGYAVSTTIASNEQHRSDLGNQLMPLAAKRTPGRGLKPEEFWARVYTLSTELQPCRSSRHRWPTSWIPGGCYPCFVKCLLGFLSLLSLTCGLQGGANQVAELMGYT